MEITKELNLLLGSYAKDIVDELSKRKTFDVESMTSFIKTQIRSAVIDCSNFESNILEQKIIGLREAANRPGIMWWEKKSLEKELEEAKRQKKRFNVFLNTMKKEDEYIQLKNYVRQHLGEQVLNDFFEASRNKITS